MYSLLIIDDERFIREGLAEFFDWHKLGIEVIGTASNGEEALNLINHQVPNIIISDIKMPTLNGIDLLEIIRKKQLPCEVIFISAYENFSYAQKAIDYGAFAYLLKPIDDELLTETVKNCIEKLSVALPDDTDEDLLSFLFNNESSDTLIKTFSRLLPDINNSYYYFVLFTPSTNDDTVGNIIKVFTDHVHNQLSLYDQNFMYNHFQLTVEKLNIIICYTDSRHLPYYYHDIIRSFPFKNSAACNDDILLGFSELSSTYNELPKLYIQASCSLLLSERKPDKNVFIYHDAVNHQRIHYEDFMQLLFEKKLEEANNALQHIFFHIASKNNNLTLIKYEISKLVDYIEQNIPYTDIKETLLSTSNKNNMIRDILGENSVYTLYELMKHFVSEVIDFLVTRSKPSSLLVEKALDYIVNHYAEDISLNKLCDLLFVSPSYLSKMFSTQIGTTFSKYLSNYRVNKAKEYLLNFDYKIFEIAEKVGYPDIGHFSKIFKNYVGISPSQYKKSHQG